MPEWHLRKHLSPPPLLSQCRDTWGDTLVGRTPFTSRHRKRRTLPGVTKMVEFHASKAPRKGRADTQHRTQETGLYLSHRGKGATCMLFFFFSCRKATRKIGVSSNLRRSTEGNTKEPAKYLLFLNYLKNGCCRRGEGRSAALRDQSDVGECCWPVVSPVTESQPRSPLPTQSFLFQWSLYAEWHWHL